MTSIEGQLVNSQACHRELLPTYLPVALAFITAASTVHARVRRWSSRKKSMQLQPDLLAQR